jgi:hypothetical protein
MYDSPHEEIDREQGASPGRRFIPPDRRACEHRRQVDNGRISRRPKLRDGK